MFSNCRYRFPPNSLRLSIRRSGACARLIQFSRFLPPILKQVIAGQSVMDYPIVIHSRPGNARWLRADCTI
jgi:hypothetical protein